MVNVLAVLLVIVGGIGLAEQAKAPSPGPHLSWDQPAFCKSLDCPKFKVLSKREDYELREYEPSMWVQYTAERVDYETARSIGFKKCFRYIAGANDKGVKIDMTIPVLRRIAPDGPDGSEGNMSTSFFVPFKNQPTPPKPTDPEVFLNTLPAMQVYVRSFGGYATEEQRLEELMKMADAIGNSALYKHTHYYTTGYDNRFKWWDRHNEVWIEKK